MNSDLYENFAADVEIDDCYLVISNASTRNINVYTVENGKSTCRLDWGNRLREKSLYDKYFSADKFFSDFGSGQIELGVHVYRYENKRLTEHKCFKNYDGQVYQAYEISVILLKEYGIEPADEKKKLSLQKALKDIEKFKESLVYACYINDTELIVERAAKASKAQLNRDFNRISNPLGFCAKNNNLIGFKAIAENGADINKRCNLSSPLNWALIYSPDIVLYIHDNFKESFDKEVSKKGFNTRGLEQCTDVRIFELFRSYGFDMSMDGKPAPPLHCCAECNNVVGIQFFIDNGVDFMNLKNQYKQLAIDRARGEKTKEAYELLKKMMDERSK